MTYDMVRAWQEEQRGVLPASPAGASDDVQALCGSGFLSSGSMRTM
ncbi:MAG TPA: hypothetical protein VGF67_32595 [Ktedonobacteraceae bacterium]|jgi:hypothetical protein